MDVFGIGSQAVGSGDVGDEHGGERGRVAAGELGDGEIGSVEGGVSFVGSASHFDRCTVHVHLAIAHFVEPGPCESVCSRSDACWDGIAVCIRVGSGGGIVCSEVTRYALCRATSLDGVNDHPFGALRRGCVGGKRDLA